MNMISPGIISPEEILYTELAKVLRETYKGISVYNEEVEIPASYPCVTFVESSNVTYRNSFCGDSVDHNAMILYMVNIYSNLKTGGKQQCKEIANVVDIFMQNHGFYRNLDQPLDNLNRSIKRRVVRYKGIVSPEGGVYKV